MGNWKLVKEPVLVLGIGNILMRDEGVGVHTAAELIKRPLPEYVEVLDGGTSGADLLDFIADRRKVVIIDAADADVEPGTILKLKPDDLEETGCCTISLHEFGVAQTILAARHLNCAPKEAVIIAVKPYELSAGIGLSKQMQKRVPILLEAVLEEIGRPLEN